MTVDHLIVIVVTGRPSLTGQSSSYDVNWKPVVITMKMAILALRALSIDSAADVPCNQTGWYSVCS